MSVTDCFCSSLNWLLRFAYCNISIQLRTLWKKSMCIYLQQQYVYIKKSEYIWYIDHNRVVVLSMRIYIALFVFLVPLVTTIQLRSRLQLCCLLISGINWSPIQAKDCMYHFFSDSQIQKPSAQIEKSTVCLLVWLNEKKGKLQVQKPKSTVSS